MNKQKITFALLITYIILAQQPVVADGYTLTPDGTYVGGDDSTLTPDGSYVGGRDSTLTPDGSYVGSGD